MKSYPYTIDNGSGERFDVDWRYRTEFALLELPAVVRHVVIPFVYVMGTLLGKYKKFKDAPPPRTV